MMRNWSKWLFMAVLAVVVAVPAWAVELKLSGEYELQGRYYAESDVVRAKYFYAESDQGGVYFPTLAGAVTDPYVASGTVRDINDNDAYLKHYFTLSPELVVNDDISVFMDLSVFANKLDGDAYGKIDQLGLSEDFDSYSIFRVDNLYADVTTDYGKFILGKTPSFLGAGWFIQLPDMEEWTFGLIWDKSDEDGQDETNDYADSQALAIMGAANLLVPGTFSAPDMAKYSVLTSDNNDEDAVVLYTKYEKDNLSIEANLGYSWAGKNASESKVWAPVVTANYAADNLGLEFFVDYRNGTFLKKNSNKASLAMLLYSTQLGAAQTALSRTFGVANLYLAKDLKYSGALATYVEASYKIDDIMDMSVTPVLSLAYASGADSPNEISGCFADDVTFGSWLMNDVSDAYNRYFETPATNDGDACGNPGNDDYSFTNIMLVRLGADVQVTENVDVSANLIYAQKADTTYLEDWNPELGTLNMVDPNMTKINTLGNYASGAVNASNILSNDVDKGMGWEANAKVTYQVMDNFKVALQGAYYQPGDFYESAFEGAVPFANAAEVSLFGSGLEIEPEMAARWMATVSF